MIYLTFLSHMYDTRAYTQLIIERKEVVCCLSQVVKVIPLDHSSTRIPPQNVATSSSKYYFLMEAQNPILHGIGCHHQKRRRSGKHWKAKVRISNHTCLKQDKKKKLKTYPNFHTTKCMTLRVLWQIKLNFLNIQSMLNQFMLPRINLLKHP